MSRAAGGPPRSGTVACIGRTNVGKSTLMNRLLGQKLAIVSPKPQTTSRCVRGIVNAPGGQFVLVDTPGLHAGGRAVNRSMVREALRGLEGADAVLAVTDPDAPAHPAEEELLRSALRSSRLPAVLALNKADTLAPRDATRRAREAAAGGPFAAAVALSALTGRGLDRLLGALVPLLPPGEPLFPADQLSDRPEREFFGEMIREQIFLALHQELPYSAAVVVEEVRESGDPHRYRVEATIHVERPSQKGILIGAGGSGLRRIGEAARGQIEALVGAPVHLALWVKVRRNWTRDERSLREFGFERR